MCTLITGANGFLGKHVVSRLKPLYSVTDRDHALLCPSSSEMDLTNLSSTLSYFEKHQPITVLHIAAACGGIKANQMSPADFIHLNTQMTVNLFEAIRKFDVKYLYGTGSVCAYPKYCPVPFKEDDLWNGYPEETNAAYGIAKRNLLAMQQAYRSQYGLKGAHFIVVNMYGEFDSFDKDKSHVIGAFVRRFVEAKQRGDKEVVCWGTGQATREFIYAGDCAMAMCKAVQSGFDSELPINIGTGVSISINDLAYLIKELTEFQGDVIFSGNGLDGQPKRQLDVSRAKELFGFEATTSLRAGLARTINWYIEKDKDGK